LIPIGAAIAAAGAAAVVFTFFQPEWQQALNHAKADALNRNSVEARQNFLHAFELAQQQHDHREAERHVLQDMAEYFFSEAQKDRSIPEAAIAAKQMTEALKILGTNGTPFEKAHILDDLGEVTSFMHDYSAADGYYKEAINFRNHDPGPKGLWLAGTLIRQAINYQAEKKYDLAERSWLTATDVLERGGEKVYLVNCYNSLAGVESMLEHYAQANKHYDQCIKLIESTSGKDDQRLQKLLSLKTAVLEKLAKPEVHDDADSVTQAR
jgi:tetratricopeptide (TPR) repeat protein